MLGLRTGSLHVGITHWIGAFDLAELLAEFHRDHPGIDVSLSEDDSDTMLDMLDAVRLDLVVSNVAPGEPVRQGMERLVIGEEPLALVAHPGASARRGPVAALRALANVEMVSFGPRTSLRQIVDAAVRELGVSPRITFETNQPDIMKSLITRRMAWSIVPYSLARTWSPVLQLWRLKTKTVRRVGLTWSLGRALQPAAVVFRDRLQQRTSDL